jgi:hypothetical protein
MTPEQSSARQKMSTQLGQFNIDVDEKGGYNVKDTYNFNASDEDKTISNPNASTRAEVDAYHALP